MKSKKWVRIWFVFLLIIPIVGVFNYYIDSFGIFNKNTYLDKAAKQLASGKIIVGLKNFDERIFRKKTINHLNRDIEWVALGSSRIMQLRKRMFLPENVSFQNYSVSGASLKDYLALIQCHYNKFGELPKNIIIGVDPWIFNKNSGQTRLTSLHDEYIQFLSILGINHQTIKQNNLVKLFSLEYTKENVRFIRNKFSKNYQGYYIFHSINVDDYLREPDGSIQYPYKYRHPNFETVEKEAINYASGNVYLLENFDSISNQKTFELFIKYLTNNNVNVYFYLPPYNPNAYDILMKRKYQIINDVEEYLRIFGKENSINVIGSYNPYRIGLTNENFFDGMHTLDNAYEILFSNIINNNI